MVIKTASPGVIVNEVDLTRGTSDAITTNVGGFVGPFARGPVDEMILIETEAELQRTFGDPTTENAEFWYTVSDFLEYGGVCFVVRCDDASGGSQTMKNAASNGAAPYIKNYDSFEEDTDDGNSLEAYFVARTPGSYGNALGVAVIDAGADAQIKLKTTGIKNSTGGAAADATRPPVPGAVGVNISTYERLKVASFVTPTPFAAVATASIGDITLEGEQTIGGVTTSTSRILVTNQTASSDNGIYVTSTGAWTRAADADASSDFLFGKSVEVTGGTNAGTWYQNSPSDPVVGSDGITFSKTNPIPAPLAVGDYVVLGDPLGGGSATGYISALSADSTSVTVNIASGTFVGAVTTGSHLEDASGNEISGEISVAEGYFGVTQYDAITATENDLINGIFVPVTYTVAVGNGTFGWTKTPRPRQQEFTTAGVPVEYNSDTGVWEALPNLAAGGILGYAGTFYTLDSVDSWYDQQIAFEGIPWYRFAPRPGTSLNAVARGASNDELNILVFDATGDETGSKGNTLEQYTGVSKLKGALTPEGGKNYYHEVINEFSQFVFAGAQIPAPDTDLNSGRAPLGSVIGDGVNADYITVQNFQLTGGVDQLQATLGERQIAYNKFTTENVSTLDYILQGPAGDNLADATALGNFLISIVEERRDCMCFLSPPRFLVVNKSDSEAVANDIVNWADSLTSSSYAVFDSGYKYTFDRFNEKYIYVPLNGDTAGTLVFTSITSEPYYSPAGISRGQIRNVVKLPFNPSKAQRDILYAARVNPVVTFPGEGTVLFGDKTALAYSSAFDRINVRKLFLIVEKEIAEISRVNLFEFNDEVTRTLFKNNVNPFLRDIQSKRGMTDFLVVCDATNNPPEIVDRNELVADIYIKPAKSINFITLNFVATKTGMNFDESVALFRGTGRTTGA